MGKPLFKSHPCHMLTWWPRTPPPPPIFCLGIIRLTWWNVCKDYRKIINVKHVEHFSVLDRWQSWWLWQLPRVQVVAKSWYMAAVYMWASVLNFVLSCFQWNWSRCGMHLATEPGWSNFLNVRALYNKIQMFASHKRDVWELEYFNSKIDSLSVNIKSVLIHGISVFTW